MKNIKLIALDVDGTLTNGDICYDENHMEFKTFNAKDGLGIKTAIKQGLKVCIITGRESIITTNRSKELGCQYLYQNIKHKVPVLEQLCKEIGITPEEVAYVGDDINDLGVMEICGFTACPSDASMDIINTVDFVSSFQGGKGAVREVIEGILRDQNLWTV